MYSTLPYFLGKVSLIFLSLCTGVMWNEPASLCKTATDNPPLVGQNVTITCNASLKPPITYTWTKNAFPFRRELAERTKEDKKNGRLEITNLTEGDKGTYTCKATNTEGKKSEKVYRLIIKEAAKILPLNNVTSKETGTPELVCRARGNPLPQMTIWKHPPIGKKLGQSDRHILKRSPYTGGILKLTLRIRSLRLLTDIGVYTCIACNIYGSDSKNMTLNIPFGARFFPLGPAPPTYTHQASLQPIECVVLSNPIAVISWKRDNKDIVDDGGVTYTITIKTEKEKYRTISNLTVNVTSGEEQLRFGYYTCVAEQNGKKVERRYLLEKGGKPGKVEIMWPWNMGDSDYRVNWKPSNDGGMEILDYILKYRPIYAAGIDDPFIEMNIKNQRTTAVLRKLLPETNYEIAIIARNPVGTSPPATIDFKTPKDSTAGKDEESNMSVVAVVISCVFGGLVLGTVCGLVAYRHIRQQADLEHKEEIIRSHYSLKMSQSNISRLSKRSRVSSRTGMGPSTRTSNMSSGRRRRRKRRNHNDGVPSHESGCGFV